MNDLPASSGSANGQKWQMLGRLDLSKDVPDGAVAAWLARTLNEHDLRAGLFEKMSRAIQDAVIRETQSRGEALPLALVLAVYISPDHPAATLNWGFFITEKVEPPAHRAGSLRRTIELYLYREGG